MKETKRGRQKYKMKYTEKNMSIADFYNEKNFYISVEEVNCIERERGLEQYHIKCNCLKLFSPNFSQSRKAKKKQFWMLKRHDVNWEIRTIYVLFNSFNSFIVILLQLLENEFFLSLSFSFE